MAVTVNPTLTALVTLTEVLNHLSFTNSELQDESKDALLRLINGVSAAVEGHCHVPLVKGAATEYYDGGRSRIILRRKPVDQAEPFTVLEDGVALTPAADGSSKTETGGTPDFWLDPGAGIIERDGRWATGRRIVTVTYTAGRGWQYQTGGARRATEAQGLASVDIPSDLREAVLIICKAHSDLGPSNFGTQILADGQVLRPKAWPVLALKLLDQFVFPRVG